MRSMAHSFAEQGFVVLEDMFGAPFLGNLDHLIRSHFGQGDAPIAYQHPDAFLTQSQTEVIPWFPTREGTHPAFNALENDATLATLTTAVLGPGWRSDYCMVMASVPGSAGQAWHQDCAPEPRGAFNLNRLVYTADVTEATGGQVGIVPGSHRRGVIPQGEPHGSLPGEVVLAPKRGTLILLHGHTWHRVWPVRTFRSSVNCRALPSSAPNGITDICVYRNLRYRFSTSEVVETREPAT